ncbi:hypothetical protein PR202_ga28522 [Eleusine coracana subsp. coracana]|uniref:Uncharacterized protein n=1 Tax=Eleusine coracana subsp. coracana TaxID=191504 RepID=A0AAV5DIR5_ELECO|nr:hypothetical protein PR202_ga28522 [Eleusine coracana subsp. coracana]
MPHGSLEDVLPVDTSSAVAEIHGKDIHWLHTDITFEELNETMLPKAKNYFHHNIEAAIYQNIWRPKHGAAFIQIKKAITEKPSARRTLQGSRKTELVQVEDEDLGFLVHIVVQFLSSWVAHAPTALQGLILNWVQKEMKSSRLIGLEKVLKKKNSPWGPPVSDPEETHPAEAALPGPSRAAWSPAYGQRPLPRIDGPTRTFGHPSDACSNAHPPPPPLSLLSLSLSLSSPLPFRRRLCPASPGRHRPPEPEPSFWKQRRDDPMNLHQFPLRRAAGIGRSARFFPGTDTRP